MSKVILTIILQTCRYVPITESLKGFYYSKNILKVSSNKKEKFNRANEEYE